MVLMLLVVVVMMMMLAAALGVVLATAVMRPIASTALRPTAAGIGMTATAACAAAAAPTAAPRVDLGRRLQSGRVADVDVGARGHPAVVGRQVQMHRVPGMAARRVLEALVERQHAPVADRDRPGAGIGRCTEHLQPVDA